MLVASAQLIHKLPKYFHKVNFQKNGQLKMFFFVATYVTEQQTPNPLKVGMKLKFWHTKSYQVIVIRRLTTQKHTCILTYNKKGTYDFCLLDKCIKCLTLMKTNLEANLCTCKEMFSPE